VVNKWANCYKCIAQNVHDMQVKCQNALRFTPWVLFMIFGFLLKFS